MSLTKITCILGKVASPSEGVVVDSTRAHGNSSKWIFDVEHNLFVQTEDSDQPILLTKTEPDLILLDLSFNVQLLDYRSSKPKPPGLLSPHVSPLDAFAAGSRIFFPEPDKLLIKVLFDTEKTKSKPKSFRYRVTVDALHSMYR